MTTQGLEKNCTVNILFLQLPEFSEIWDKVDAGEVTQKRQKLILETPGNRESAYKQAIPQMIICKF